VLLASAALNVASLPPFLLLEAPGPGLFVLTAFHLIVGGALFSSYFTYATDLVPATRRAEGIAIFGVAGMLTNALGPALGEVLIARTGYAGFFLTATAFGAVSLALTFAIPPRPPGHATGGGGTVAGFGTLLRPPYGPRLVPILVATAVFGVGVNAAFFFVAPFVRELGITRAAPFFVAYASATVALRVFGRRLPDRLGAHAIALPAFCVFAIGLALLALLPAPGLLVVAGTAAGAGHGFLFPTMNALAVSRTPPPYHGAIVSLYTAAMDFGGVVGTPLCGAAIRVLGYRAMFLSTALAALGGFVLLARDRRADRARTTRPETRRQAS
jgi:predicted MFS family arabinose efflux permease